VSTYDSVLLAVAAVRKAGSSTDREKIKEALDEMADFCGAMCYKNNGSGSYLTTKLYLTKLSADGFRVVAER
jgi:ABC-type branched-subunit amino acid transport system substrate-binding protein